MREKPRRHEHQHTCELCHATLIASDAETLSWGVSSHRCGVLPFNPWDFGRIIAGLDRDPLECTVISWLAGLRGGPFWWFNAEGNGMVVT
jgi:hypothetical protein